MSSESSTGRADSIMGKKKTAARSSISSYYILYAVIILLTGGLLIAGTESEKNKSDASGHPSADEWFTFRELEQSGLSGFSKPKNAVIHHSDGSTIIFSEFSKAEYADFVMNIYRIIKKNNIKVYYEIADETRLYSAEWTEEQFAGSSVSVFIYKTQSSGIYKCTVEYWQHANKSYPERCVYISIKDVSEKYSSYELK